MVNFKITKPTRELHWWWWQCNSQVYTHVYTGTENTRVRRGNVYILLLSRALNIVLKQYE